MGFRPCNANCSIGAPNPEQEALHLSRILRASWNWRNAILICLQVLVVNFCGEQFLYFSYKGGSWWQVCAKFDMSL